MTASAHTSETPPRDGDPTAVLALRIERTIRARRERVFAAWTQSELLGRWSAPEGMTVEGENDLRVGGSWRAIMTEADGTRHVAVGEYREITPPSRLVYTHAWVRGNGTSNETTASTTVAVDFLDVNGTTHVVLVQTGFESVGSRDGHVGGWNSSINRLEALFDDA